nr:hypothetical protein HmN_000685500 [Hymenolepis microstoma]
MTIRTNHPNRDTMVTAQCSLHLTTLSKQIFPHELENWNEDYETVGPKRKQPTNNLIRKKVLEQSSIASTVTSMFLPLP